MNDRFIECQEYTFKALSLLWQVAIDEILYLIGEWIDDLPDLPAIYNSSHALSELAQLFNASKYPLLFPYPLHLPYITDEMLPVLYVVADEEPSLHIPYNDFSSQNLLQLDLSSLLGAYLDSLLLDALVEEVSAKDSLNLFHCNSLCELADSSLEFGVVRKSVRSDVLEDARRLRLGGRFFYLDLIHNVFDWLSSFALHKVGRAACS